MKSSFVVGVEHHPETPIKVSGTAARPTAHPFSTPFSAEIINAPRYGAIKMSMVDLYDRTTDPEEHLGVYKVQMYVQDVDDTAHCGYFSATLKGLRNRGLMVCPREAHLFPGLG